MPAPRFLRSALFTATLIGIAWTLAPTPAEAQFFLNFFRQRHYQPPPPPANSYVPDRGSPFGEFFDLFRGDRTSDIEEKPKSGTFAHHCVRTCDGKFFPVNKGSRQDLSADKICSAMCPAAQTKVFSGHGIDQSVSTDGQKYSSLPNAFAYRTKIVDNCTCNGRDPFGVAKVDLDNDPTLQNGDIVVKETGVAVYRGPHKFTSIESAGVSPALVKQLQTIRVLPNNPHATFAKTMPVAQDGPNPGPAVTSEILQEPDTNTNAPASGTPARRN